MPRITKFTATIAMMTALALPAFAQDQATETASDSAATEQGDSQTRATPERSQSRAHWAGKRGYGKGHGQRFGMQKRMGHPGMGMMRMMLLSGFDANDDGRVTRDELTSGLAALADKHDADGDGSLSLDEFADLYAEITRPLTVRAFQWIDTDGDGQISAEEREKAAAMFARRLPKEAPEAEADDN